MMALQMIGYTDVSILGGGMQAWEASHAPPFDLQGALGDLLADLPDDAGTVEVASLSAARPFVLDVRYPEEYATGFIEGALNIPLRELTQHLDALPAMESPIVLVDNSGFRSAIAMTTLRMMGYQNAQSLVGGMNERTRRMVTGGVVAAFVAAALVSGLAAAMRAHLAAKMQAVDGEVDVAVVVMTAIVLVIPPIVDKRLLAWPWFAVVGSAITFTVGLLANAIFFKHPVASANHS